MRGTELIASMVDKVYVTALTSQKSGGPASKHHAPKSAQLQSHPCFVLQLTCPPQSYDVLCEPDKTMAVFSNPNLVKLCVKKLLLLMFEEFRPDLAATVDILCGCGGVVSGFTEVRSRERDVNDGSDAENIVPEVCNLYAVQAKGRALAVQSNEIFAGMTESPDFKSVFLSKTPPEDRILTDSKADQQFTSQPISLFSEFEFSTTPPHGDGEEEILGMCGSDKKWKLDIARAPQNRMYGQSESSSDNESSGEDSFNGGTCFNAVGRGVTVSRLPGLVESIDHDILGYESNSPKDENDYESVSNSVDVYDDSDSSASEGSQYTINEEEGFPCSGTSSPIAGTDDRMSKRILDINVAHHKRTGAAETHAQPQSIDQSALDFSYPDPSHGYFNGASDYCNLNILEQSITPVERAAHLPVNLFCTEFSDAFFSSGTIQRTAKLDSNALEKHNLTESNDSTLSAMIGKKRLLEADNAQYLSMSTTLDADFLSQDRRSSLLRLPRHDSSDVTIKKSVNTKVSVKLTKDMLSSDRLRIVGQVDAKYVLARTGSLMIIIDQHAADERVKLEEMLRGCTGRDSGVDETIKDDSSTTRTTSTIRMTGTISLSDIVEITSSDAYTLVNRPEIFTSWGFLFDLIPEDENAALRSMTSVNLKQVPVFYGEALNADDFIEFVHYVSDHSRWAAPHSLFTPPSLKRIAASKACRTAVKFGDILDLQKCTDIMSKLSETDLPFQCAHGRPSAVPLLHLQQPRGRSTSPHINSTIHPFNAITGPKYLKSPNYSRISLLIKE